MGWLQIVLALASLGYSIYQGEEGKKNAENMAKPTGQDASKYNELVKQLSYMAGVDPTNMYKTDGLRDGATLTSPGRIDGTFDPIPDQLVDAAVGRAQRDTYGQLSAISEKNLADGARRGLAGSSMVDQANAYANSQAGQAIGKFRTDLAMKENDQKNQFQQQALTMLGNLSPENAQQQAMAFQALQSAMTSNQSGWANLGGALLKDGWNRLDPTTPTTDFTGGVSKITNLFS